MAFNRLLNLSTSKCLLPSRNSVTITRDFAGIKHRAVEEKLNIPPRPKRPLNPFMKFLAQERPDTKKEFPEAKITEVTTMIGTKWYNYDQSLKKKLEEQYKKEMIDYSREVMEYERSLTDEQKMLMRNENRKMQAAKEKNKMHAKLVELGKPKRPPTAFILFMLSKLSSKNPNVKIQLWLTDISKEWSEVPPEKREKFETESKKLMSQYKNDLIQWEDKMIRLGHIDVVRGRVLLDLKDKRNKK